MPPRFSIVLPTRHTGETLRYTLRTFLAQEFDDFEVVVSDNSQSSVADAIVSDLGDARISVVHTPRPLSMVDSWNFAIAHARGEYVTLVGDDDGLLLHALPELDQLVTKLSPQIIRYETVHYWWPDAPTAGGPWPPNTLLIPLFKTSDDHSVSVVKGRDAIREAAAFERDRTPSIRCAVVHRSLVETLKSRTGTVFQAEAPDAYSGFAFAALADELYHLDAPIDIKGYSGDSTYLGVVAMKGRSAYAEDFEELNSGSSITRNPEVPQLPLVPAFSADAFLQAKRVLFPEDDELALDKKELAERCLYESHPDGAGEWAAVQGSVRETLVSDPALVDWFDAEWATVSLEEQRAKLLQWRFPRYASNQLKLDASLFGIADIVDATEFVEKLLGYRAEGLHWRLAAPGAVIPADTSALRGWLRERWHGFLVMTGLMNRYIRARRGDA